MEIGSDKIGGAELIPDLGVLLASLFLPKFFGKFSGTPQYSAVAKTLSEQFMPEKSGRGFQDEILLAEVSRLIEPYAQKRMNGILKELTKGEKRFFVGAIALFAAKYQKEKKETKKGDENSIASTIASLDPITKDSPVVVYLNEIFSPRGRTVGQTIEMLRQKGMIKASVADKIEGMFADFKTRAGGDEAVIAAIVAMINTKRTEIPKMKLFLPGFIIAHCLGNGDTVELYGTEAVKSMFRKMKGLKQWKP